MHRKEIQVNPTRLCNEKLGTLKWILLKHIDELPTPLHPEESQPNQSQFSAGDVLSPRVPEDLQIQLALSYVIE